MPNKRSQEDQARAGAPPTAGAPPDAKPPRPWPATAVEMWTLDKIIPYPRNAIVHDEAHVAEIAASMLYFGVTAPVLVDEAGVLIYGHGRRLAAALNVSLGHKQFERLPTVVAEGWSEEDKRAYRVADNQIGRSAEWDAPMLKSEIGALRESGFRLNLLGFPEARLMSFEHEGIDDPLAEWRQMPGYNSSDKTAFKSVVVHFKDQAAVDKFAKLVKQQITPKTRFLWYPEIEIETYADKRYEGASEPAVSDLHPKQRAAREPVDDPRP